MVGLAVGFGAAAATFFAVDYFGTPDDEAAMVVVHDDLDYDGYCESLNGGRAIRIADDSEGWRCGGFVDGLWSPVAIDLAGLCHWQYGDGTEPRVRDAADPFGWICIDD